MKRFWLCLILCVVFAGCNVLPMIASGSPVPDTLPEDFGGKTRYGYMMDLKNTYMPATVFSDAVKYSNSDRDNAFVSILGSRYSVVAYCPWFAAAFSFHSKPPLTRSVVPPFPPKSADFDGGKTQYNKG